METVHHPACEPTAKACLRFAPVLALLAFGLLSACAMQPTSPQTSAEVTMPLPPATPELLATGPTLTGVASWYTTRPGLNRTCSGQIFTGRAMTAASHTIPVGTRVRVALVGDSERSIVVLVNDCMPREGRILDLSKEAARQLGIINAGIAEVNVTPVVTLTENH